MKYMMVKLSRALVVMSFFCMVSAANTLSEGNSALKTAEELCDKNPWKEPDFMCGPRCLWQVAYAYGGKYSLNAIASMAGTDLNYGTTVKGMVEAAHKMALQAKAVKTNIRALAQDPRVAILLLAINKVNHYVILDKIENGQVRLLDGDKFRNLSVHELKSIWDGYAILIGQPGDRGANSLQRYFGTGLQISGLLILLAVATYGVKSTYLYLSKRQ